MTAPGNPRDLDTLLAIMARLRDPEGGCPWDREQDFATIAPYTLEEAYEVAATISDRDWTALREELGDLLFQVVFHARMAEERGLFAFADVVETIVAKMVRRHPHVFAGKEGIDSAERQTQAWEEMKAAERAGKRAEGGVLAGVPLALPALARAVKLQVRAGTVGFDWKSAPAVADKIAEEARELAEADKSGDRSRVAEELGDLLFAVANLARHLNVDPEGALRAANAKFVRRFRAIEKALADKGQTPAEATLDEMEALWREAKDREK